jgi:hypothetical protein
VDSTLIWNGNWAWNLPLIVLNVIFHVLGLGFINAKVIQALSVVKGRRHFLVVFALVLGIATLLGNFAACDRGRHLGRRISGPRSAS